MPRPATKQLITSPSSLSEEEITTRVCVRVPSRATVNQGKMLITLYYRPARVVGRSANKPRNV